jgi:uncharacterized protein
MPTGQHWYVSVTVAKGAKPGKRVVLVSGVHGDEMSSVHTVQAVMNQLDPAEMSGTVMARPNSAHHLQLVSSRAKQAFRLREG